MSRNYKPAFRQARFYNRAGAGFVTGSTEWKYSSVRNFTRDHIVLEIGDIGFLG